MRPFTGPIFSAAAALLVAGCVSNVNDAVPPPGPEPIAYPTLATPRQPARPAPLTEDQRRAVEADLRRRAVTSR